MPKLDDKDIIVKCSRCRFKHTESERVSKKGKGKWKDFDVLVCPRCECKSYIEIRG